jgi:hypothetical protein
MKTLLATVSLFVSLTAFAAPPVVRAERQQARINQGLRSGELTGPEAARLQARENHIERQIVRDRIDGGGMTAAERARIEREQNHLSHRIAVQKHDRQAR